LVAMRPTADPASTRRSKPSALSVARTSTSIPRTTKLQREHHYLFVNTPVLAVISLPVVLA
jgi:hypothetical protein